MDLTLLRSLNMRRPTASGFLPDSPGQDSLSNSPGQDTREEVVEVVESGDDAVSEKQPIDASETREVRRDRRSVMSRGDPRPAPFQRGDPRPAPLHTLALLLTLADLNLPDSCLASLLCRIADHPLLASLPGEEGRNCGGEKCGISLF